MQSKSLINLITGILEDSMKLLIKVEKNIEDQNRSLRTLSNNFDNINNNISNQFENLNNNHLEPIFDNISSHFDIIDTDNIKKFNAEIDEISKNLQNNFQFQSISLLNRVIILNMIQPQPRSTSIQTRIPSQISSRRLSATKTKSTTIKPIIEEDSPVSDGDWSESQLEGADIFENTITGWKRRDFDKAQGTKEIFMRAWKKLSSYDQAQIRNGAWSGKLINKIKMMGRE